MTCFAISWLPRSRLVAASVGLRARALDLRGQAVDLGLERARVDAEQQLALLDVRALGELRRVDEAGDARLDRNGGDRLEAAGEFLEVAQRACDSTSATLTVGGGGAAPAPARGLRARAAGEDGGGQQRRENGEAGDLDE